MALPTLPKVDDLQIRHAIELGRRENWKSKDTHIEVSAFVFWCTDFCKIVKYYTQYKNSLPPITCDPTKGGRGIVYDQAVYVKHYVPSDEIRIVRNDSEEYRVLKLC